MAGLDLSKLSAEELQAELQRREKEQKKAEQQARKELEDDKEAFTKLTSGKFLQIQKELKGLKDYTIKEANLLYNRMYEINGKEPKEQKSLSIKNKEGNIKITVERQDRFEFTDEAIVHINAIKDIFKEKFAARNKGLYNLLDSLLIKNSKMDYDPKLLAKARKQVRELGDENLIKEFDKLDECQRVSGTALYCRLHVKDNKGWQDVSLNFSSL